MLAVFVFSSGPTEYMEFEATFSAPSKRETRICEADIGFLLAVEAMALPDVSREFIRFFLRAIHKV